MESKIYDYIESVFRGIPQTERATTIKSEIFQNLVEKYRDLKQEGKSDDEAYAIAISSGGDLTGIAADLRGENVPYSYSYEKQFEKVYEKQYKREKKRCNTFYSWYWPVVACVYLLVGFLIRGAWAYSWILFLAAAAGANLYRFFVVKSNVRARRSALNGAVWTGTVAIYFILSFATMRWDVTWLVFLLGVAASNILHAVIFHSGDSEDDEDEEEEE